MPSEPPRLRKCAEIFLVESTKLLIYKCARCLDWFSTHLECQKHVQNGCPEKEESSKATIIDEEKTSKENNDFDYVEYLSDAGDIIQDETPQQLGKVNFDLYAK